MRASIFFFSLNSFANELFCCFMPGIVLEVQDTNVSKADSCPIFGRKDSVPVRPSVPCFFFATRPRLWNSCLMLAGGMVTLF